MHIKGYYDPTISDSCDPTISDFYDSTISDFYDSTITDYFSADNNHPNVVVTRCFSANNHWQPVQSKSTKFEPVFCTGVYICKHCEPFGSRRCFKPGNPIGDYRNR